MVRDHRGREWSVATKDCPNFSYASFINSRSIQKSRNPVFSKVPHKNFKVLLKRCSLGSYDLPGFLDYWIIINLTRLWDQITGMGGLCSPISSNQSYEVSMQPRPWLERSDPDPPKWPGPMEKVETCFYPPTAIHQLRPKWDRTKR